jgi:hypothetical protein
MNKQNYYEVLGLAPGADGAMVNQAYWHAARKYQAMAPADPRAQHQLDELNEAYGVLGTPHLRKVYDTAPVAVAAGGTKRGRRTRRAATGRGASSEPARTCGVPLKHVPWRYAAAATIVAGAVFAGVLSIALPIAVLGATAGVALAVTPLAWRRKRMLDITGMRSPRMAAAAERPVEDPEGSARKQAVRRVAGVPHDAIQRVASDTASTEDIRVSTAAMRDRWRTNSDIRTSGDRAPDTTLVDIFQSERAVETDGEPLSAVIDILRGARRSVETH